MLRKKVGAIALLSAVAMTAFAVPAASAAKITKPPKPVVAVVNRVSVSGRTAKVRVFVDKGAIKGPVTIEVTAGNARCTIKSSATSCVLFKLSTRQYYNIKARSKNKAGYSAWSKSVGYWPNETGFIRAGYDATGKRFPSATLSATYRWKTLGTTSKWTKFQALKRSGVSSASLRPFVRPRIASCGSWMPGPVTTTTAVIPDGEPCVVFQVNGIVGLAQAASTSTCGSNVSCALAVTSDGTTTSLFVSGSDTPAVKDFYSTPNGKLYVVFTMPTRLVTAGPTCVFVEVNVDTGIPTCVDKDMTSIQTVFGNMYGMMSNGNPPVQFDNAGNVYYMGTNPGLGFTTTLREYSNGTVRNIVNDNVTIRDFIVLGNGTVLVAGSTSSTQASWIRSVSPSGQLKNLLVGTNTTFVRQFADGNIYFGIQTNNGFPKIVRYLVSKNEMDSAPWIGSSMKGMATADPEPTNDRSILCQSNTPNTGPFCQQSGVYVSNLFNIGSQKTVGVAGSPGGSGGTQLIQYWPTLEYENTIITNISISYRINGQLLLTGTDSTGKNILTIYDPETNQEQIILDGSNEVEIYSMAYVPATKKLMFNGLQFSDNKYVVAEVAVP